MVSFVPISDEDYKIMCGVTKMNELDPLPRKQIQQCLPSLVPVKRPWCLVRQSHGYFRQHTNDHQVLLLPPLSYQPDKQASAERPERVVNHALITSRLLYGTMDKNFVRLQ